MEETFDFQKLSSGILKANRKIVLNYLDNLSGYNHDARDIFLTYFSFYTRLFVNQNELFKVQGHSLGLLNKQWDIWQNIFFNPEENNYKPLITPHEGDRRFQAAEWNKYPYFDFIKQVYLLYEQYLNTIIDEVEMTVEKRKKFNFYSKQYSNFFSPANFLFTNPEALELAAKTNGESLWNGFNNFLNDLERGKITQTDFTFEVGKNLAITPGEVIFENELLQLIQYKPSTKKVKNIPLLIFPPWINKYYILDLRPENSFVKFLVDDGFTVFIISWRDPQPGMGHFTFDNYAEAGIKAIEVTCEISKVEKINTLGYCMGGTLLGTIEAILAAQNRKMVNSITLLATMLDFTDIGPMGEVIDEALVKKLERGELLRNGILHGNDMERAFNLIRANDLVWNFAVNNYLKGLKPKPFDVLYWTNDNTNLPAKMYLFYMKHMVLRNKLSRKNALTICDSNIDIGKINVPVYVIAFKEDYISPAITVFTTTQLVSGPVEFIYGESGHVMGVANPPTKKKYGHYVDGELGKGFEEWKKTARFVNHTWWLTWVEKLRAVSGEEMEAPLEQGNKNYKIIEPAPGSYVKEKCYECFPHAEQKEQADKRKQIQLPHAS